MHTEDKALGINLLLSHNNMKEFTWGWEGLLLATLGGLKKKKKTAEVKYEILKSPT